MINLGTGLIGSIVGTPPSGDDEGSGIIGGLLSGIKRLFVPSQEDISKFISDTTSNVDNQAGIFAKPSFFFKKLLNESISNSGDFVIEIPDIKITASLFNDNREDLYLFRGDGTNNIINFTQMVQNEPWATLYNTYIIIISGVWIYTFLSYIWSFYDHLLGSRDVESAYQIIDSNQPTETYKMPSGNVWVKKKWTGRFYRTK